MTSSRGRASSIESTTFTRSGSAEIAPCSIGITPRDRCRPPFGCGSDDDATRRPEGYRMLAAWSRTRDRLRDRTSAAGMIGRPRQDVRLCRFLQIARRASVRPGRCCAWRRLRVIREPEIGPGWGRVRGKPFFQIASASAWTTLQLTIHADGRWEHQLPAPAPSRATGSTTTRAARGEERGDRLRALVARVLRAQQPLGRRGLADPDRSGGVRARARPLGPAHAWREEARAARAEGRQRRSSSSTSPAPSSSSCSTGCSTSRWRRGRRPGRAGRDPRRSTRRSRAGVGRRPSARRHAAGWS